MPIRLMSFALFLAGMLGADKTDMKHAGGTLRGRPRDLDEALLRDIGMLDGRPRGGALSQPDFSWHRLPEARRPPSRR